MTEQTKDKNPDPIHWRIFLIIKIYKAKSCQHLIQRNSPNGKKSPLGLETAEAIAKAGWFLGSECTGSTVGMSEKSFFHPNLSL